MATTVRPTTGRRQPGSGRRLRTRLRCPRNLDASRAEAHLAAVLVTYRSARHLEPGLTALRSQLPEGARLVVWDNGSGDGTAELARRLAPAATVVGHDRNVGFAAAVNGAAALVPGRDLLLLNPDAVVRPGAVAALVAALAHDRSAAVVAGGVIEDGNPVRAAWRFPTPGRACVGAMIGLGRAYRAAVAEGRVQGAFTPFTFALLRRTAFDQLGGLDERFWLYGEDADYCFRAAVRGWSIVVTTAATVDHDGRGSSDSRSAALTRQLVSEDRFREIHAGRLAARLTGVVMLAGALGRLAVARLGPGRDTAWQWRMVARHYVGSSSSTSE